MGLDPAAALDLRRAIAALAPEHTVLLTTHDMAEADALCHEITMVNKGLIVAQARPEQLKWRVAGSRRVVVSAQPSPNGKLAEINDRLSALSGVRDVRKSVGDSGGTEWTILCADTAVALDQALAILRDCHTPITTVRVIEPTLEDVFLTLAGRSLE
jgi:ABC-2 type transport system ATP-binding protein